MIQKSTQKISIIRKSYIIIILLPSPPALKLIIYVKLAQINIERSLKKYQNKIEFLLLLLLIFNRLNQQFQSKIKIILQFQQEAVPCLHILHLLSLFLELCTLHKSHQILPYLYQTNQLYFLIRP